LASAAISSPVSPAWITAPGSVAATLVTTETEMARAPARLATLAPAPANASAAGRIASNSLPAGTRVATVTPLACTTPPSSAVMPTIATSTATAVATPVPPLTVVASACAPGSA
jgi:hypothetical protein